MIRTSMHNGCDMLSKSGADFGQQRRRVLFRVACVSPVMAEDRTDSPEDLASPVDHALENKAAPEADVMSSVHRCLIVDTNDFLA